MSADPGPSPGPSPGRILLTILLSCGVFTITGCEEGHYGFPTDEQEREYNYANCIPRSDSQGDIMQRVEDAEFLLTSPSPGACRKARRLLWEAADLGNNDEKGFCIPRMQNATEQADRVCP